MYYQAKLSDAQCIKNTMISFGKTVIMLSYLFRLCIVRMVYQISNCKQAVSRV